ncbi:alpha/beta fold hydrolase [Shimia sp.]|uniref:alpha/beta fold hydrolase n=1 Tax=Shimia sp. TaxID=1954381 RepID=UPI003BAC5CB3
MYTINKIEFASYGVDTANVVLVLVHGLGASARQFDDLIELASNDLRLICANLPGHDENFCDPREGSIGFVAFRDLLIGLCDDLKIRNAVFCGISMGAALSLMVAKERPDLCRHIVAIRPAWLTERRPENLDLIGRIGELFRAQDSTAVRVQIEATPLFRDMAQDVPRAADSVLSAITRDHAPSHAPVLSAMVADAPFRRLVELREIRCPVCVVGTNADALHPIELAHQTANALPNARLEILPPRYLAPEAHARALKDLVRDVVTLSDGVQNDYQKS